MHFWINKGNQQGHYWSGSCRLVRPPPEAVANYLARRQIIRPRGLHPKPMVTPVRRFQSLESVSNNGLRHSRSSPGHRPNRPPVQSNAHIVYYNNATNVRIPRTDRERSIELNNDLTTHQTLENDDLKRLRKYKYGLLAFALFSAGVMFGANYLSAGELWRVGVETLIIISIAIIVLLLGGIIIIYLHDRHLANFALAHQQSMASSSDNMLQVEVSSDVMEPQRPTQLTIQQVDLEMSPPPYHIAVRLGNQPDLEGIQIHDDQSPPPPYEKAVT